MINFHKINLFKMKKKEQIIFYIIIIIMFYQKDGRKEIIVYFVKKNIILMLMISQNYILKWKMLLYILSNQEIFNVNIVDSKQIGINIMIQIIVNKNYLKLNLVKNVMNN